VRPCHGARHEESNLEPRQLGAAGADHHRGISAQPPYVWMPSTRHARDAKSSGAVATIACVCTQHTHEAQVTRPFTDGHVELCDMMATGVKKAGRLPAFELGVAYQIVNPGSSTLLSATLRHLEISGLRARQKKPEMSRTPAQRALSDRGG
jgi:hypothetical protein